MPFNGSGTFTRLYSWVQDAANGIDILSTRMDNEMNGMATALSDCVTRDGQSPWTANLPAGGFKITGLGTPTSSADSATKGYVDGIAQGEWKAESNSFAWVSGTQFKLTGVDLTATYHVGRRLKIVHNSGGSTAYATITATAFSTDTTVTVVTDDGSALVASITAVSYGIISYVSPSYLDPRSAANIYLFNGYTQNATSGSPVILDSVLLDVLSEFTGAWPYKFTVKHTGNYLVIGRIIATNNGSSAALMQAFLNKNGSNLVQTVYAGVAPGVQTTLAVSGIIPLAAGDYLQLAIATNQTTFVGGGPNSPTALIVARLP